MSYQCRRWCFTWFDDAAPEWAPDWMSYLLCGKETCPTTGRLHWQGYLETRVKVTLNGLKAREAGWETAHLEQAKGTWEDSLEYCTKECGEEYLEWGEPMIQGKRTDLSALASAVLSGTLSVRAVLEENPHAYHVYGRTLEKLEDEAQLSVSRGAWAPPCVIWMWGPTGLGKSRRAMEEALALSPAVYRHSWEDKGWWDRYRGETAVILDEFRCQIPFHQLLTWLDGYEISMPRRGRPPRPFLATHIWVTSSKHPRDCYDKEKLGEDVGQLLRRITRVIEFVQPL